MEEVYLRKWHRRMGGVLALFLFIQGFSGFLIALELFLGYPGLTGFLTKLHFGGGSLGHLYRLLLGLGLMGMATSGGLILLKIRGRTRK